ncbi:MAG: DEAD/DEAH box helicase [Candidatus Acidiferrum sp.]
MKAEDLLRELLAAQFDKGFAAAMNPERTLYSHQEQSIRRVDGGRNAVVATGTGSGKTESYLYPILLHLYRESLGTDRPRGVRALVLYPMNALANDQRRRLGEYCSRFRESCSGFAPTFGQYTGETPKHERDSRRYASQHEAKRLPGELVFRTEMQDHPPDILLTNYSMLEYLLLRPDDSPLFDEGRGKTWHFLVLDEAHQYRGSKGMEMAMLLRRLKQRLREGGCEQHLRCIATSASLGRGAEAARDVAKFAKELFDEPDFVEEDVIVEEREVVSNSGEARLPPESYPAIAAKHVVDYLASLATKLGLPYDEGQDPTELLYRILQADARTSVLRKSISTPWEVSKVAAEVFDDLPEARQEDSLAAFVDLLTKTQDPKSGAPLLSARYHFFLRSLEGAFVTYSPTKKVCLERTAPPGQNLEGTSASFEVALCRECGQHYFVGRREQGKLREAIRDQGTDEFNLAFFRPIDEAGALELEVDQDVQSQLRSRLCLVCGDLSRESFSPERPACTHGHSVEVVEEKVRAEHEDQMRTCGACGYRGPDPVREVVHGTDGPNAVVATTLHRSLPVDRRKVLAFADGRQEAAFFAWYAQNTYEALVNRNVLLRSARALSSSGPVSIRTLARHLREEMRSQGILQASQDDLESLHQAWTVAYQEFVTDEPRLSLQGLGLMHWWPLLPENLFVPQRMLRAPWSLSESEARILIILLLESMRAEFAVELRTEPNVAIQWEELRLKAYQSSVEIRSSDGQKGVKGAKGIRAWDGVKGRRVKFLARLLTKTAGLAIGDTSTIDDAQALLREVWEVLKSARSPTNIHDGLLLRAGDAMRLNPDWWRVQSVGEDQELFRCQKCGRYQMLSLRELCPRPGCDGNLCLVDPHDTGLTSNHYRTLYQEEMPPTLRAEEHTAQIDKEKAREFQAAFEAGQIHLLSCSTTFELGVDLGDLDTIFLRNVPPEPFNYSQRVGRAGRRPGHPGFAVTYCRRRPHDLDHFAEPSRMLDGKTRPPVLHVTNEKIVLRHVAAVALSLFFRSHTHRARFGDVGTFCVDLAVPHGVLHLSTFLKENQSRIERILREIVPEAITERIGVNDGSWVGAIAGTESRLARAEAEVSSDYVEVAKLERQYAESGRYRDAAWARDRAATIAIEDVISFLSRKAAIPKYGFPVDVVELELYRTNRNVGPADASNVSLQRDLAIAVAEFAPGSKIVANKKLWTSYGLKKVIGREWDRREYLKCTRHGTFHSRKVDSGGDLPAPCCDKATRGRYIDPIFGFVTDRKPPEDPSSRPAKVFTTRPYFSRSQADNSEMLDIAGLVSLTRASPGYLVVLCEGRKGQGFHVCRECGIGPVPLPKPLTKPHQTSFGRDCRGTLDRVALGHEFLTDVLRLQFHKLPTPPIPSEGLIWFTYALAYALLEGTAEVLQVPPSDLSVTVKHPQPGSDIPEIVLYDNVPGGAGLVARLENAPTLRECLEEALRKVSGLCGCDENTSCDGCLRSYTNQFAHARLARGPVARYLANVLEKWE